MHLDSLHGKLPCTQGASAEVLILKMTLVWPRVPVRHPRFASNATAEFLRFIVCALAKEEVQDAPV